MNKGIVFLVIFLILVGSLTFLYFHYEKPIQKKDDIPKYTNLTIFAEDSEGNPLETGYLIFLNGSLYAGGDTDIRGGVKQIVVTNNLFIIENVNLKDQNYYTTKVNFNSPIPNKVTRIDLKLDELGVLNVTQKGNFLTDNKVTLILSTNETFKNLRYCLKWSELLVNIQPTNDELISDIYDNNYKCYETNSNVIKNHPYTITLNYNPIGVLTPNDYIKVDFYDNDENLNQNYTKRQEYIIK